MRLPIAPAVLALLCSVSTLSAGAVWNTEDEYPLPRPDTFIAGPIVIKPACPGEQICLPQLEEAPTGRSIDARSTSTAEPGDYLFGTLDAVGLPPPGIVKDAFRSIMALARERYETLAAKPADQQLSPDQKNELDHTPSEFTNLPSWYRQDVLNYERTEIAEKCGIPLTAVASLSSNSSLRANLTQGEFYTLWAILQDAYRAHCLSAIEAPELRSFIARLAYFVDQTNDDARSPLKCVGIVVGYNLMLTARHCMTDSRQMENAGPITVASPALPVRVVEGTRIIVLGIPNEKDHLFKLSLDFSGFNDGLESFQPFLDASKDYILVRIDGLDQTIFPPVKIVKPQDLMQIDIPALYLPQSEAISISESGNSAADVLRKFDEAARIDTSPLCKVWKVKGNCIAHACQTEPGFSGTPILAEGPDGLGLVGIHTGAFGTKFPACDFTRGAYVPNYGVLFPAEALKAELDKRGQKK